MSNYQDWTPCVINANKKKSTSSKDQDVNIARRRGEQVETVKKFLGGQNRATKVDRPNLARLDEDTGDYKVERVSFNFGQALQKARLAKNMTQAQLAQLINEKPAIIGELENGRAIPNGQVISRLNRALGVQLPKAKESRLKSKTEDV